MNSAPAARNSATMTVTTTVMRGDCTNAKGALCLVVQISPMGSARRRIRLGLLQLIVPQYRVPVFDGLFDHPDIDLTVVADTEHPDGSLVSAAHLGRFPTEHREVR